MPVELSLPIAIQVEAVSDKERSDELFYNLRRDEFDKERSQDDKSS